MEDLNLQAPQWVDFTETHSPMRMQDFFEKSHSIHERIQNLCDSTSENTENIQLMSNTNVICVSTEMQADLEIIKNTPIKIASPEHGNNEELEETTYDQVLSNAMRQLDLCKKPLKKTREALNKTTQESTIFRTPNMSKTIIPSKIVCRSVPTKCIQTKALKNTCILGTGMSENAKGTSISHHTENDLVEDSKEEKQGKEEDNKEYNEEDDKEQQDESKESDSKTKEEDSQDDVDATIESSNRTHSSNKHSVLTWHNHRRSLQKRRTSVNKKYVSLAEAVSRFQNETPKRFHTRSNKVNNMSMSKTTQNRLKPTIPISPALVSKNRSRPVTVLSREEREKLEMEEMKKHPIKAKPIPPNVLRGSRVMKKHPIKAKPISPNVLRGSQVMKKPTAAAHNSMPESNGKVNAANLSQLDKSPLSHRNNASYGPKNVTKLLVTDPSGLVIEREEISFFGVPKDISITKNVTRIVPFSFEARNKDLQMKKEQRLKNLQEVGKTKTEFHARPVPNFSKPPTPPAKQQQQNITKKLILPCPFSFDNRDKKLYEKKEHLVKQLLEKDKQARVFRANPVPVFKPVMIRGRSKENLSVKNKNVKIVNEQAEDQENKEPNIDSLKAERKNIEKVKDTVCTVDKQKAPLKAYPLKLNTDKRAKERCEFNEKMRRKEMEEETKQREAEKKRLESEKLMKAELRKLMEMKAKPMPMYKAPLILKSTKQLTNPQSPAFASKLKSKQT